MVNGPAMGSMGWLACSVIQNRAHFTVSAWDLAALTHRDGELHVGARISRRVCLRCRDNHWRQKRELSVLVKLWDDWYSFVRGNLSSLSLEHLGPCHCLSLTLSTIIWPIWLQQMYKTFLWIFQTNSHFNIMIKIQYSYIHVFQGFLIVFWTIMKFHGTKA